MAKTLYFLSFTSYFLILIMHFPIITNDRTWVILVPVLPLNLFACILVFFSAVHTAHPHRLVVTETIT